jgi:hypothetical protein
MSAGGDGDREDAGAGFVEEENDDRQGWSR